MKRWVGLPLTALAYLAGMLSLGLFPRSYSARARRQLSQQVSQQLARYLRSIGVPAEPRPVGDRQIRRREDEYAAVVRQLADIRVSINGIDSIEVWRKTLKARRKETIVEDEITYLTSVKPGLTLSRIPILTWTVRQEAEDGRAGFRWQGFEWGRLSIIADRLRTDTDLNERLLRHFNEDVPGNIRIRALAGDRVGISTSYDAHRMPSRHFLTCIKEIARHVDSYVDEQTRQRADEESFWPRASQATARRRAKGG